MAQEGIKECPYLAKYYYDIRFNDLLLMEMYLHGTLAEVGQKFKMAQSLNTKLYIMFQLAMALNFLKEKKVFHGNLNPGNILVSKQLIIKLIDFGSAIYYQSLPQQQFSEQYAWNLPYTAPETIKQRFSDKNDVFSFGIILYEFLFNEHPVEYRKSQKDKLLEKYKSCTYQIRINKHFFLQQGPKKLMKVLRILVLKCLDPDQSVRPTMESIIYILRESLAYIEKMY